ncbi:MAG: hypothetical protein QOH63_3410 [Acidobacteriota bacterium]|nr:hypothetical protein [Acidobacteriota bacterium]
MKAGNHAFQAEDQGFVVITDRFASEMSILRPEIANSPSWFVSTSRLT